jgi:hypothetical protein
VLSQDDGTSSSDRRAIECPKAGNVRKTRQCAHRSPSDCKIFQGRAAGESDARKFARMCAELACHSDDFGKEMIGSLG